MIQFLTPVVRRINTCGVENDSGVKRVEVAIGIVVRDGWVLICQRPHDGVLGGFWEFPGGKREPKESIDDCLRREIKEEVDLDVLIVAELAPIEHEYPHAHVTLYPRLCQIIAGEAHPHASEQLMWVRPASLADYEFPPANAPLLQWIVENVPQEHHRVALDESRIRQFARMKQANLRWHSYCLVGAIACGIGAANLIWRAIAAFRIIESSIYFLAAAALAWGCMRLLQKARELDRQVRMSSTSMADHKPDFSALSDGSQVVKNLEEMGR